MPSYKQLNGHNYRVRVRGKIVKVSNVFYVPALSIFLTSCVTAPDKDFYQADKQPVFQKKTCISLKILNGNATKPFSKEYLEYSTAEYNQIKFELSKYNLEFDCTGSVRNYTLISSMSLNYPFVSYPWLVISSLTLTCPAFLLAVLLTLTTMS